MPTQEEIQKSWADRWADKEEVRPPCYNRPDLPPEWDQGCPHWRPGGNAYRTVGFPLQEGKGMLPWGCCFGCRQRTKTG